MSALLEIRDLSKHFHSGGAFSGRSGVVRAVDGVSLEVAAGETLAIVGESGCGKSTLGRLALRLLEPTSGSITFAGQNLAALDTTGLRALRRHMQMIFQDPFASLNPRMTVASIVGEPLWLHGIGTKSERRARTLDLLATVGLRPELANRYPHEFSGGQRQRIGIARALASGPKLLIGDEPVSALDVSIQAQVLNLLADMKAKFKLTLVIISHDLAVVRHISDRVAVMYLGRIVESAPTAELFAAPHHPYTQALLAAIPQANPQRRAEIQRLDGDMPSPANPPPGCHFHARCPHAQPRCRTDAPPLRDTGGRAVACHFSETIPATASGLTSATQQTEAVAKRLQLYRDYAQSNAGTRVSND